MKSPRPDSWSDVAAASSAPAPAPATASLPSAGGDARLVLLAPSDTPRPRHRPFAALAARLRWSIGFDRVRVAHLDAEPHLSEVVDELAEDGARRVRVLPLFLTMPSHVRRELSHRVTEASEAHPDLQIRVLPLLGEENGLFELLEGLARRELVPPASWRTPLAAAPTPRRVGQPDALLPATSVL